MQFPHQCLDTYLELVKPFHVLDCVFRHTISLSIGIKMRVINKYRYVLELSDSAGRARW